MYIKRTIEKEILEASKEFACVTIYGARQVGKSTVVEHLFKDFAKITLDDLAIREYAFKDPKGLLDFYGYPLVIDEIQKAPGLLEAVKIKIDECKRDCLAKNERPKLIYALTGSNQFELQEAVSDSLAGRTAVLNMCSLSFGEIYGYSYEGPFNPDFDTLRKKEKKEHVFRSRKEIFEDIYRGGMPELVVLKPDRDRYLGSYVSTYIEKRRAESHQFLEGRHFSIINAAYCPKDGQPNRLCGHIAERRNRRPNGQKLDLHFGDFWNH